MTLLPMPTVEQLVQVFKDNNWTALPGSSGTQLESIQQGKCCAIPALLKLANALPNDVSGQRLYDLVSKLYGYEAVGIWNSFDDPNYYTEDYFSSCIGSDNYKNWIRLGRDLRLALQNL